MNYEDYNSDSICRSIGLKQFIDEVWPANHTETIRVVFKPAFHPEAVLTITKAESSVLLSVVVANMRIWSLSFPQPIKSYSEQARLDELAFSRITQSFDSALEESKEPQESICLDGMGFDACRAKKSGIEKFSAHVSAFKSAGQFASKITKLAWDVCVCPEIKNGLSDVARYTGLSLPKIQVSNSPLKPHAGILVLGNPEEKEILSKAIKKHRCSRDSNAS